MHLNYLPQDGKDYVSATTGQPSLKASEGSRALVLACSSDRGLCGAIHGSVSKLARRLAAMGRESTDIVVLGDKAKPQICRDARNNIVMHFNQVGRSIPTFLDALSIWQSLQSHLEADKNYSQTALIYNRFVSVLNFDTVLAPTPTLAQLQTSEKLTAYEYEMDTISNLTQYLAVCRLFWALVEGHAAEMSSKRTAMDNATKNSEAMTVALTMKYNRTRQAVITNELVDIIVGASAL